MAYDWTNPDDEKRFRQNAISAGYKSDEVDKYVLGRKTLQQETQLYSEGKIAPDALTGEKRQELTLEAAKRGLSVKGLPTAEEKKQLEKKQSLDILAGDLSLFKNNYENISTKGPILGRVANQVLDPDVASFQGLRDTLAFSLASALAQQTGRSASDKDIQIFRDYLPTLTDTPDGANNKMNNAVKQFSIRMKSAGATDEEIQNAVSGFGGTETAPRKNLAEAALQDVKDLVSGTAKLTSTTLKATHPVFQLLNPEESKKAQGELIDMAKGTPRALLNEAKEFVDDPVKYVSQNPVDTVLLFAPILGKFKAVRAGKAGEIAAATGESSKIQKVAEVTTEFLNGAGPKEFIAQNVNKDAAQSLAQTALRNNVYSAVTTKGIIQNVQKAITDIGSQLGKAYKKAPEIVDSGDFTSKIETSLLNSYPGQESVISQVMSKLENLGKPVIEKGTTRITPERLWKATQGIEEYGLKQLNLGELGKVGAAISKDTSRLLRNYLYNKVPEAAPLAVDYRNLKVLMDTLPDVSGITNLVGLDKLVNKINVALSVPKEVVNYLSQKAYNLRPPAKVPTVLPEQSLIEGLPEVPPQSIPVLPANRVPMSIPRTRAAVTSRWTANVLPETPPASIPGEETGTTLIRDKRAKVNPRFIVKK